MAGRHVTAAKPVTLAQMPGVDDPNTQRALDVLHSAVQQLQTNRTAAAVSVTGSRASGAALENLLTVLEGLGIITDDTTA